MRRDEFGLPRRRMITRYVCVLDLALMLLFGLFVAWVHVVFR